MADVSDPPLNLSGQYGTVYIWGAHWKPGLDVGIDIYMPVSAGGDVYHTWAYVESNGTFFTSWRAPHACLNAKVEVQVHEGPGGKVYTAYVIPGCI